MLVISRLFDDNRVYYPKEITNDESTNVLNTHSLKLCSEHKNLLVYFNTKCKYLFRFEVGNLTNNEIHWTFIHTAMSIHMCK